MVILFKKNTDPVTCISHYSMFFKCSIHISFWMLRIFTFHVHSLYCYHLGHPCLVVTNWDEVTWLASVLLLCRSFLALSLSEDDTLVLCRIIFSFNCVMYFMLPNRAILLKIVFFEVSYHFHYQYYIHQSQLIMNTKNLLYDEMHSYTEHVW
jgi:hypothetical protein